jgi:histone-lysine N-methyltransferase SETD8
MEYLGELIDEETAQLREKRYGVRSGCYMFYFRFHSRTLCIDSTVVSNPGSLDWGYARYCAHTRLKPTLIAKRKEDKQRQPHILLCSTRNLSIGTELTFDYGDRENATQFEWLNY